jgi:thymidine kinase
MAKVYFYYSAMNAGKTTALLQSDYNYRERGMRTVLFTPAFDQRAGAGVIRSRIGLQAPALGYDATTDLETVVREETKGGPVHCVLVDEAQFLTRQQVLELTNLADFADIPILCYGLRTDFRGELFEGSHYLLAWADDIKEIKTMCPSGRKATMVLRVDERGRVLREGAQIEIGGNERYVSVSRRYFKEGRTH